MHLLDECLLEVGFREHNQLVLLRVFCLFVCLFVCLGVKTETNNRLIAGSVFITSQIKPKF